MFGLKEPRWRKNNRLHDCTKIFTLKIFSFDRKTTIYFLFYRLAFLYSCSYLKVSSKHKNQDDLNGCSLVKHHSQVSSPLKLLARRAINVCALSGYFMCTWNTIFLRKKNQFMQLLRTLQYFKKKPPKKLLIIGQIFLVLPTGLKPAYISISVS